MSLVLPTPFSALIFDCDGTLVDTAPAHFHAISHALAAQGHTMDREWYMARTGLTPDALLDEYEAHAALSLKEKQLPIARLDRTAVYARYNQLYHSGLRLLREVAFVADVAREFHGRVPLSVASNGIRANVVASLLAADLLQLFDHIVAAEDVSRGKPAPDVFLEAARRMQVAPAACIVLEDSDEGLAAATSAGMRAIDIRKHMPVTV